MEAVVIWIIVAAINGVVAHAKNRREWLWVLLGIIFGVFSLIVLVVMPKIKPKKVCPKCSNEILQTALVCHHCYHDFKAEADRIRNAQTD